MIWHTSNDGISLTYFTVNNCVGRRLAASERSTQPHSRYGFLQDDAPVSSSRPKLHSLGTRVIKPHQSKQAPSTFIIELSSPGCFSKISSCCAIQPSIIPPNVVCFCRGQSLPGSDVVRHDCGRFQKHWVGRSWPPLAITDLTFIFLSILLVPKS